MSEQQANDNSARIAEIDKEITELDAKVSEIDDKYRTDSDDPAYQDNTAQARTEGGPLMERIGELQMEKIDLEYPD